jgi:outer membrane protein OmpA-like peptidoglycan-associated protein
MGNVLYDIDFGLNWVSPYVGIGAGYQAVSWNHVDGQASGIDEGTNPTAINIDHTLGGFAYQLIVGFSFPVDYVPGLAVTLEYRYMNLASSRDYSAVGSTPAVSASFPNNTTRVHAGDDANHSILVGLRYAFDMPDVVAGPVVRPPPAPVPAPVPAAAAVPARTYLVFFDWDSAELTPRARDIIAEAVRNSAHVPHTRIEVTGHADRSGTARGNMALSLRRAQKVASELVRWGVPNSAIDIHAAGDTRPLVPTAAGVRQSENRRVEIVYQ